MNIKWPYRKVKGLVTRYYERECRKKLQLQIENKHGKSLYLFCAPTHSNLGDQAQLMCWIRIFKEWYPEHEIVLVPSRYRTFKTIRSIHEKLTSEDLLYVHSGYLMFDPHPELPFILDIVRGFYDYHVVILPQTVNLMGEWYRGVVERVFNQHDNLTLMCRDEVSFGKAKQMFPKIDVRLMPDVVTTLIGNKDFLFEDIKKDGVMFCVRSDMEQYYSDEQINNLMSRYSSIRTIKCDTTIKADIWMWANHREELIKKMLRKMASYQVIITDRYHGTIFSQIVNTPVIVISSTDHKLSSGVKWFPKETFGKNISFAKTLDEAYDKSQEILKRNGKTFPNPPYFREKFYSNPI